MKTVRVGRKEYSVSWTALDRLVEAMSPARGLARLKSRTMLALTDTGYTGGRRDRRQTRNWRPREVSANEALSPDLPDLRSRSHDLYRNVPIATGAINTVVTNVVNDGLVLQSQIDRDVLGLSEEQAKDWQKKAEREFAIWARNPDFSCRLNWDEIQELTFRSVLIAGDTFVARRRRIGKRDTYGLKLQIIDAARVSNPNNGADKADLCAGVEMDADGVPIAYHISTGYPDGTIMGVKREWKRYDLGSTVTGQPLILHLYKQVLPDQARGIPYLAPVIEAIKMLGNYADAEVNAAVVSAMFTVFVTPGEIAADPDAPSLIGSNGPEANVDRDTEIQLGNGAIVDLAPGDDAKFANPNRPNTAFDGFVTAISRHIGVALELPYEVLLKSFTASYSASKAALEMAWQFFGSRRTWLSWKFCQPIYEWVITEAVATGRIAAPGFFTDPIIREAWLGSAWIGRGQISLDPLHEANAYQVHLDMHTMTRQQILAENNGGDIATLIEQRAREDAAIALITPIPLPAPAAPSGQENVG